MKTIAILGTRGIPNHYGGFEQLAEHLALELVKRGYKTIVYNSSLHPYKKAEWNGVIIKHRFDPENRIGTAGQFIYDLNCILDLRKLKPDVILQLGYTSSSIWHRLLPKRSVLVTNMDGLEWKRQKYSKWTKRFLLYAEGLAVRSSHKLIADSLGITDYLLKKYGKASEYIPYGANEFADPEPGVVKDLGLEPGKYFLVICRLEPENNIEMILKGFVKANSGKKLVIVGNYSKGYGKNLKKKYGKNPVILFTGAIYDSKILNNLRHFSSLYFHGHSTGGTNPSLIEAMAAGSFICAHNNIFNESVLGSDGRYFSDPEEVANLMNSETAEKTKIMLVAANIEKVRSIYNWQTIFDSYENVLTS